MSLTNPINKANLISRFNQLVTLEANASIQYSTSNKPFPEAPDGWFGGGSAGFPDLDSTGISGTEVNASSVFNSLVNRTAQLTRIRFATMRLEVTGLGITKTESGIAFLSSAYQQTLPATSAADVQSGFIITRNGLDGTITQGGNPNGTTFSDGFFQNLRRSWESRRNNPVTLTHTICHSQCHSSCHGSRGRR
jgi:hypothetical protein